ncbi:MAG: hypothetical protein U0T74_08840 [Chitinophagales bacterium]
MAMLLAAFTTQAQTPTMVKDINNGSGGSNTSDLVDVNGTLFLEPVMAPAVMSFGKATVLMQER